MSDDIEHIKHYFQRLAEYMACSPGTIRVALEKQNRYSKADRTSTRLGEILMEQGTITEAELESALRRQRVDRLRRCYIFESLNLPELTALSSRFREVTAAAGRQFIVQDELDPMLYVLAVGRAEVYRTGIGGNWINIAFLEPGAVVGEMGYFQGGRRTASVRAIERCELLRANYSDLTHYFENVPRLAHKFVKLAQERQAATDALQLEQAYRQ